MLFCDNLRLAAFALSSSEHPFPTQRPSSLIPVPYPLTPVFPTLAKNASVSPFRMNTCKNRVFNPLWNEHLQKTAGGVWVFLTKILPHSSSRELLASPPPMQSTDSLIPSFPISCASLPKYEGRTLTVPRGKISSSTVIPAGFPAKVPAFDAASAKDHNPHWGVATQVQKASNLPLRGLGTTRKERVSCP